MIAVDTNILVYAHRRDAPGHAAADAALRRLAERPERWAIPWPCIYEFLSVSTNARAFRPPSTMQAAIDQVEAWLASGSLVMLAETSAYWGVLSELLTRSGAVGGQVHDARIAALCLYHGVTVLLTADRDFARFPRLRTSNPLTT